MNHERGVGDASGDEIRASDTNESIALYRANDDVARADLLGRHQLVHAERGAA